MSDNGKKRQLTHAQFFELCNWVIGKKDLLRANAPTYAALAMRARKELAIDTVSEGAVKNAIETTKTEYACTRAMPPAAKMGERLRALEAEVAFWRKQVRDMARALGHKLDNEPTPLFSLAVAPVAENGGT